MRKREIAVISLTVIMFAIVAAVFLSIYSAYTDNFKQDFNGIYLSVGKIKIHSDTTAELGNVKFKVHNAWLANNKYTVQVLPAGDNFVYGVDGQAAMYLDLEDLTSAFDIQTKGSSFTIRCKGLSMQDVLEALYPDQEITILSDQDDELHYKLVVTTSDCKYSIAVTFRCGKYIGVDNVEIDPPNLVF